MEEVVTRVNLAMAMKRVRQNRGSPGIDGMTVDGLPAYMEQHEDRLRRELLAGTYRPHPVRRKTIPKPGGERELGISTVVDRVVQQAILQVLGPRFDAGFSKHSHGFRPKHSAHGAVREAQQYIREGCTWVVDVDLERFFDRVNHDVLMGKLAMKIADRGMLVVLRRFLDAGGRNTARWAALAAAGERDARRHRPDPRSSRSSIRSLCRRLQCVRAVPVERANG